MWGFGNGGDLSTRPESADLSVERGHPAAAAGGYRGQRRLFGQPQHASFLGQLWSRNQKPQLHSVQHRENYTTDQLNSLVTNPFQSLFVGPGAIFNEPDSRYNDPTIPLINLLRPYPQFDGEFDGFPISARIPATTRCNSGSRSGAANTLCSRAVIRFPETRTISPPATIAGWDGDSGGPQALDN